VADGGHAFSFSMPGRSSDGVASHRRSARCLVELDYLAQVARNLSAV
jgi:hypothetical protein